MLPRDSLELILPMAVPASHCLRFSRYSLIEIFDENIEAEAGDE